MDIFIVKAEISNIITAAINPLSLFHFRPNDGYLFTAENT